MFFYEVEGRMPKLSSFGKTIWPKKSLTSFLHAALQLLLCVHTCIDSSVIGTGLSEVQHSRSNWASNFKLAECELRE